MKKLVLGTMVFSLVMIAIVGIYDRQERVMWQGRNITIHVGPRSFYNVDYTSIAENGIEVVEVADWVFWRQSYKIKNFNGHWMTRVTDIKACAGMECWDPFGYEKIPLELRRHIEYTRQRAIEEREIMAVRVKPS